jgi:hypothetical protein
MCFLLFAAPQQRGNSDTHARVQEQNGAPHKKSCSARQARQGSASFLKKTQKLWPVELACCGGLSASQSKVFWFFFSKKNGFLTA